MARSLNLTPDRIKQVLAAMLEMAEWVSNVPRAFTWPLHEDDDHLFNLAIACKARFLVTWESRILKLGTDTTPAADLLRQLAPDLSIVSPADLAAKLKAQRG